MYTGPFIVLMWYAGVFSLELEEEDEVEEIELTGEEWFLPMTFAKKLPKQYYRGTDPEWQSFMELSKDKAHQISIQSASSFRNISTTY